jgi:N-acyl-D-aspartate/D-glutamate deacylase
MAASGRGVLQCSIGKNFFHDELTDLARRHNVPVTWTALVSGMSGPGSHQKHLDKTAQQRAEGLNIVPQVACRPVMFDFNFGDPFPFEMLPLFREIMTLDRDEKKAVYNDDSFRDKFKAETAPTVKMLLADWVGRTRISMLPSEPELEEMLLSDIAAQRGEDAIDLALDLSIASDFSARFRLPFLNYDLQEVGELLVNDNTVVSLSDAGAHASQLCDACYSTDFLGHWVRDKSMMEMEQGVHELTQKPADLMGLKERGRLAQGLPADVVIFDPATVNASGLSRVYDQPAGQDRLISQALGIEAVVVNGTVIRQDGLDTINADQALPGEFLR